MAVVRVADVGVGMNEPFVRMRMAVRLGWIHPRRMLVLVVFIMNVAVLVIERFVNMAMLVTVANKDHHADRHRYRGQPVEHAQVSPRSGTASNAPANGAVAKTAASHAAPSIRSTYTSSKTLAP